MMNLIAHVRSSRDLTNTVQRARSIFERFGVGPDRMTAALSSYLDVTDRYGCTPSFPSTAVLVERHPRVFQELQARGVELAIHGCVHANYKLRSREDQLRHFEKAMTIFNRNGLPFSGFRSPYLNWNADTMSALAELGFEYVSNRTMWWDVVSRSQEGGITDRGLAAYDKVLAFYETQPAAADISLPIMVEGILDLPVAMPDDEATDRLDVGSATKARLWVEILCRTHRTGELMVLNLHPERGVLCAEPLAALLEAANEWMPKVWVASMEEITRWWHSRERATVEVRRLEEGRYQTEVSGDERARLLIRNARAGAMEPHERGAVVECERAPMVTVHPDCDPMVAGTLKQLGYAYDVAGTQGDSTLHFGKNAQFHNAREVMDSIASSDAPLARIAPWPSGTGSALSVTGDIDSITLGDFFRRVIEA